MAAIYLEIRVCEVDFSFQMTIALLESTNGISNRRKFAQLNIAVQNLLKKGNTSKMSPCVNKIWIVRHKDYEVKCNYVMHLLKMVCHIYTKLQWQHIPWNSLAAFLWQSLLLKARWVYQELFDSWPSAGSLKTAAEQLQTCQNKSHACWSKKHQTCINLSQWTVLYLFSLTCTLPMA